MGQVGTRRGGHELGRGAAGRGRGAGMRRKMMGLGHRLHVSLHLCRRGEGQAGWLWSGVGPGRMGGLGEGRRGQGAGGRGVRSWAVRLIWMRRAEGAWQKVELGTLCQQGRGGRAERAVRQRTGAGAGQGTEACVSQHGPAPFPPQACSTCLLGRNSRRQRPRQPLGAATKPRQKSSGDTKLFPEQLETRVGRLSWSRRPLLPKRSPAGRRLPRQVLRRRPAPATAPPRPAPRRAPLWNVE